MLESGATFSPCRLYRYALRRTWSRERPLAMFVGLNPSTADEVKNDPTVRRCINFARAWGYGGLIMTNIFAFRSTDPGVLTKVADPVGPLNDRWLRRLQKQAGIVVAAWGIWGDLLDRGERVLDLLDAPQCLGQTQGGAPKHPLYLRADCMPVRFTRVSRSS